MVTKYDSCIQILRAYAGAISDQANNILLSDKALKKLEKPLQYIKNGYCDYTPALMNLASQSVGGKTGQTNEVALSYCLMNMCFTILDDAIDRSYTKSFKPTLFGMFGRDAAIIVGGIASAKAFQILNNVALPNAKKRKINQLFWELWTNVASVEFESLKTIEEGYQSSASKFWKVTAESIDLGICFKLGGIIGGGSQKQIDCLYRFGKSVGVIFALQKDFEVSTNLTVELEDRIQSNHLPYCTLWAKEHSKCIDKRLEIYFETPNNPELLQSVVEEMLQTNVYAHVCKLIKKYKMLAERQIIQLPANDAREQLGNIIELKVKSFFDSMKEKGLRES